MSIKQGIAFSPQTELTQPINSEDTEIYVVSTEVFPPAPNYATLGIDEEGETIEYAAVADGLLSGCRRGVEGTPRDWPAGTPIARNFTAQDQQDIIDTVEASVSSLSGGSNPNLLDNWYFVDPVNQKNLQKYLLSKFEYTIDRWALGVNNYSGACSLELTDTGIHIKNEFNTTINFTQYIDWELAEEDYTFSVLTADGKLYSLTSHPNGTYLLTEWGAIRFNRSTVTPITGWIQAQISALKEVTLIAAKLELGDRQTLARQDENGSWVLNGPPPNKQQELAKCQRYFVRVKVPDNGGDMNASLFLGSSFPYIANRTSLGFWLPQPMRINPTVKVENNSYGTGIMGHNYSRNIEYMNVVPLVNLMSNNYLEFVFTSATQPFVVVEYIN